MWIEEFRPKTLDEVVGQDDIVRFLKSIKDVRDIPHMLFSGSPGVGKTTIAHAFANDRGLEIYEINASTDRGIDVIRNDVVRLAKILPRENEIKIIFLDEADSLTPDAQTALRRVMEEYSDITIFILSCNYKAKIIPAIRNRCINFDFPELSREQLMELGKKICEREGRSIEEIGEEKLQKLIDLSDGSARSFISGLFVYLVGGYLPSQEFNVRYYLKNVKEGNIQMCKDMLKYTTYPSLLRELIRIFINSPDMEKSSEIIIKLGDYLLLSPNPDDYTGKMVVTFFLMKYYGEKKETQIVSEIKKIIPESMERSVNLPEVKPTHKREVDIIDDMLG